MKKRTPLAVLHGLSICFVVSFLCGDSSAQTTAPAEVIPPNQIKPMYQRELGELYQPDRFDGLFDAHQKIERYFQTITSAQRQAIVSELEATGIDPNILGRLTRIRLHWPEMRGGVYYLNERMGVYNVRYFLGIPSDYDRTRPWPMVVKLPTATAFVTNPPPNQQQVSDIYTAWINEELNRHPDAIVLMPLLNLDELYGPSYEGMNSVIQSIQHAYSRANLDPARVYMLGHRLGGHATWNLALHYPTYFAAINPMGAAASQDWQRLRLMNLRNVLPVVWHDATDEVIKVGHSRNIVQALRAMKLDVDYEESQKVDGVPPPETVERLYGRMRARAREVYPVQVSLQSNRTDSIFNRIDWVQVYQPIRTGEERRMYFRRGTGHMTVCEHTWKIEAARTAPNKIEGVSNNVESMRFYFNDRTIDFSRPLTIVINKQGKYEDLVKPSVDEMLKDQLFLGRGWRYFTAVVDVDMNIIPRPATTRAAE